MQSVQTPISGAGAKLALTIEILLLGASPRHFLRAYTECHLRASTGQHIQANFEYYQRVSLGHQSKGEWLRDCLLDTVNCFLDSLVSIFNPGLKQSSLKSAW